MTKPTKEQLARYVELREQKSALESEARAMEGELYQLHELIVEYMDAQQTKACKVNGFNLMLVPGRANPKWKDEFIRVAGAAAATLVAESTPKGEQLKVLAPQAKE